MNTTYLEKLRKEIAEKFDRVRVLDAKPKIRLTLDQQAEILFNVALRKMRQPGVTFPVVR